MLVFLHLEVQCDVRRAAVSTEGVVFCVWLSGSHLFLHKQETLQSMQTSTAESSTEDGLASSLREVRPKDITLKAMVKLFTFIWCLMGSKKHIWIAYLKGYSYRCSGQ